VKYTCNAFHALKVTFGNEIGNICKRLGVDSHSVMDIFVKDDKLNLSPYYLKPGFAFGGSCLPKDLRALNYKASRLDLDLPLIGSIIASNENQIKSGVELIRKSGKKKVGVLGFSFKAGTDDLRESPIVELIETLIGKGYFIKVYDKNVSLANLMGANKEFIERQIPHIAKLMCKTIEEVIEGSEIIIVGNKDEDFKGVVETCSDETIIIDLCRLYENIGSLPSNYEGICW
jgi:GDP-mannose 6-dehydrogenase